MSTFLEKITIITHAETELINITPQVREIVKKSGIKNGMVYVLSLHTTTAITVNEGLPDLEMDIAETIAKLVPEAASYHHARFLHSDGQNAINAVAHLRGALLGFEVFFPVADGEMVSGSRQTIYYVELDGPQERRYAVQVVGD